MALKTGRNRKNPLLIPGPPSSRVSHQPKSENSKKNFNFHSKWNEEMQLNPLIYVFSYVPNSHSTGGGKTFIKNELKRQQRASECESLSRRKKNVVQFACFNWITKEDAKVIAEQNGKIENWNEFSKAKEKEKGRKNANLSLQKASTSNLRQLLLF